MVTYPVDGALIWAGQTWDVRTWSGMPGPNEWREDGAFIGDDGNLHLKIQKVSDTWYSAEIDSRELYQYGVYRCRVETPMNSTDPNIVFSMFTYYMDESDVVSELDIEISKWTNDTKELWYSNQPTTFPGYDITDNQALICQIDWQTDHITYSTWYADGTLIAEYTITEDIPTVSSYLIFNLWLISAASGMANGQDYEVVISNFEINPTEDPFPADNSLEYTITNHPGAGYQAKLTIDYQTGMATDFADIRFSDGTNNIPYYIESQTDEEEALVWLKLTDATTIYMTWGTETVSASSGTDVFELWDDFTTWNATRYGTKPAEISLSAGIATITNPVKGWVGCYSAENFGVNYIQEARRKTVSFPSEGDQACGFWGSDTENAFQYACASNLVECVTHAASASNYQAFGSWDSDYHIFSVCRVSTTSVIFLKDYAGSVVSNSAIPTGNMSVFFHAWDQSTTQLDWIRVRKYVATEPTFTVVELVEKTFSSTNNVLLKKPFGASSDLLLGKEFSASSDVRLFQKPISSNDILISKTAGSSNNLLISTQFNTYNDISINKPLWAFSDLLLWKGFSAISDVLISKAFSSSNDLLLSKPFSSSNEIILSKIFSQHNKIIIEKPFSSNSDIQVQLTFSSSNDLQSAKAFLSSSDIALSKNFSSTNAILSTLLTKAFSSSSDIQIQKLFSQYNAINISKIYASSNDIIELLQKSFSSNSDIQVSKFFSQHNKIIIEKAFSSENDIIAQVQKAFSSSSDILLQKPFYSGSDIQVWKVFSSESDINAILSKVFSSTSDIQVLKAFSSSSDVRVSKIFASSSDIIIVITSTDFEFPLILIITQNSRTVTFN